MREMPEIDFSAYRVRRNPYAARIRREGVQLVHREPSARSLAQIPEIDFRYARVRRNPYVSRAAESAAKVQYGRGRPRAGSEVGPTQTRSLRLPADIWKALERDARERGTTVHALLRELVAAHVARLK
jgi:hypothetical protein